MTATTSDRATFVARAERTAARTVTVNTFASAWWVGAWFWAIYVAVLTVTAVVATLTGADDVRSASGGFVSPWIFVFAMGIALTSGTTTLHVVAGGTRRTLLRGGRAAAVWLGVTFGLAGWLVLVVRDAVVRAVGVEVRDVDGVLASAAGGGWLAPLVHVLASAVLFATGVLVAHAYQRWGGLLGTAALVLTLLPAAVALVAFDRAAGLVPGIAPWLVVVGGGVVGLALAWWGAHLVVRRMPIG